MRPTSADVPSPAKGAATRSVRPTIPHRSVGHGQRWLIQVEGGEFQLVESERELAELARLGRVTASTPVYPVGDGPRPLGEIPDLAGFVGGPVLSEPPIRLERRSPERAMLSEELAILNRPLEDEIEYYDEIPVRRWPRRVAIVLALAAGVLGACLFVLPRFPGLRSSVTARFVLPARSWVAGTSRAQAIPPPPAVFAASARAESGAVATPALETTHAPLPSVADPPSNRANDAPPSAPAAGAGAAPVADRGAKATEAHKTGRSHRRHRSGNHAATRR
jgi:hypothetical protein